ncbi:MAG: hypothetical protein GXY43_09065 [Clostridiaceae bacterium]|nr:hypothetical protein [Clostridiaceae bacterium]
MKTRPSSPRKRRVLRISLLILAAITLLALINFFPAFRLKTSGMSRLQGDYVCVYYEIEKEAAETVFEHLENEGERICQKVGTRPEEPVDVYIYDQQKTMQQKKYGLAATFLSLDWYIGDNIGDQVILTSPAAPGSFHDAEAIVGASAHELVHAYVSIINPRIRLWLTEGMALYLANGDPFEVSCLDSMPIPTLSDTRTINPIRFNNSGGYLFAHTYIEFLEKAYGWPAVMELIRTQDYPTALGKTESLIYDEWVSFLKNYPTS